MKQTAAFLLFLFALTGSLSVFTSCDDEDTYADLRKKERRTINRLIKNGTLQLDDTGDTLLYVAPIKVIDEKKFEDQGDSTDVGRNEYVYFRNTGLYMQIMRRGVGKKLENDESAMVLARYTEVNLRGDSIESSNQNNYYVAVPDKMTIANTYGTFTSSFVSGVMRATYGASVPQGWIVPFTYINIGRQDSEQGQIARVRLIVPSNMGHEKASGDVYACFYDISFQKGY